MPNTTNFNFPTPADTDLVKDGAAAIRSLGNSIDTAFVDLKGGTTGQVLSKASNTDLDFTWVTENDADAIQNSIVDAKGDLISATAADTPARLAVGANNTVLTADSSTATGLKWAAPSAASFVGCLASRTANFSLTQNVVNKSPFASADTYDTNNFHDTVTNNTRLTVPSGYGGYYLLFCENVDIPTTAAGYICFLKNNSVVSPTGQFTMNYVRNTGGNTINLTMAMVVSAVATDYFELGIITDATGVSSARASFGCAYLGA